MDSRTWRAIVHRVAKNWTQLKRLQHVHALTNYIFLFSEFLMLWHLWPQMGKGCPSQGYPILSDNKVLGNTPFTCKLINPEPKFRTTSSTRCLHSRSQYPSAPSHPRARYRQLEAILMTQSLPTLFKWASPKLLPCSGLPFSRKTQSSFGSCFFHSSPAPYQIWHFPTWPCMAWHASFSRDM